MFCSKCGKALSSDMVFCPDCGTKAVTNSAGKKAVKKSHKRSPIKMIVVGLILVLTLAALLLGGIIFFGGREGMAQDDLDEASRSEMDEDQKEENLWEGSLKTQITDENGDPIEGSYVNEQLKEAYPGYMDPEIARAFGLIKEEVIELFGEPDMFYEKEGSFPRELIYGDIHYMMVGESDVVNRISGPVKQIFDPTRGSINTLDDIISLTGSAEKMNYYVDEGMGDWSYGRGVLVATSYTAPYSFEMSYSPDRKTASDQWISIIYAENGLTSPWTGERLKGDEVEPHVREIRERYNNTVQKCNEGNEQFADMEIDGEICRVTANLNEYGEVMRIFYQKDGDKFWLYYDNYAHLEFVYVERADGSAQRWYFFMDKAFRVRYSADADKPDDSYNYENGDLVDLLEKYQKDGWDIDLYWIEKGAQLRQRFEK